MNPVIVVPYRPGDEHRDRVWQFVKGHVKSLGVPVYVSDSYGYKWSLARAVNEGAVKATRDIPDWDRIVVWTADVWIERSQFEEMLLSDTGLTHGFDRTVRYNSEGTDLFLQRGRPGRVLNRHVEWKRPTVPGGRVPVGGVHATTRELWETVRGFDPRFVGWGWEDTSYYHACVTLGSHSRVEGPLYSFWHPRTHSKATFESKRLGHVYRDYSGNVEMMKMIVADRRDWK